jgi:hypothetical protein
MKATTAKPWLSMSLDLDNLWSYLMVRGDPAWQSRPSYLDEFVDLVLPRLASHGLRITFFIVGDDAAQQVHRRGLRAIVDAGHEIANHSYRHEPWLHKYGRAEIAAEIMSAERAIGDATGQRPVGFRGPGYSRSPHTLEVLAEHGYSYDATPLPTFIGPLARGYYFARGRLTGPMHDDRQRLFGSVRDGFMPLRARVVSTGGGDIIEIPVSVAPIVRTPFHMSYLLFLARKSRALAQTYLRTCLWLCRLRRVEPSFLLHPLDFLGGDRVPQLAFFPGMDLPTQFKLEFFDAVMRELSQRFQIMTLAHHAQRVRAARLRFPTVPMPRAAASCVDTYN